MSIHCYKINKFFFVLFFSFLLRRMFPTLRCSFSGIETTIASMLAHNPHHHHHNHHHQNDVRFYVCMDIIPIDNKRYRYAYHRSSWLVAGKADPPSPSRLYIHPDTPYSIEQLRKQVISFEKVKLTNNEMDKSGHVSLKFFSFVFFFSQLID